MINKIFDKHILSKDMAFYSQIFITWVALFLLVF